jgi:hypothetical protein
MSAERRQFDRVGEAFEVKFRKRSQLGEVWKPATVLNLSAGGMRIQSPELLKTGQALELQLALPTLRGPLTLYAAVAWSQLLAAGVTEYGVAFAELSPDQQVAIDELVQFLLKRSHPAAPPPAG